MYARFATLSSCAFTRSGSSATHLSNAVRAEVVAGPPDAGEREELDRSGVGRKNNRPATAPTPTVSGCARACGRQCRHASMECVRRRVSTVLGLWGVEFVGRCIPDSRRQHGAWKTTKGARLWMNRDVSACCVDRRVSELTIRMTDVSLTSSGRFCEHGRRKTASNSSLRASLYCWCHLGGQLVPLSLDLVLDVQYFSSQIERGWCGSPILDGWSCTSDGHQLTMFITYSPAMCSHIPGPDSTRSYRRLAQTQVRCAKSSCRIS